MKIAVIGAGAMGSIYGGYLSQHNEVYLIDTNPEIVDHINQNGLSVEKNGQTFLFHPKAATSAEGLGEMDLVILFVKSIFSKAALVASKEMFGDHTYIMTLQNGSGHEDILSEFVPHDRIIIGTTEDNGAILGPGHVKRGGSGVTNIGMIVKDSSQYLTTLKETFDQSGFITYIHDDIQQLIWDKLFTNVSLSVVTGLLQVKIGYIYENAHAQYLVASLVKEAVAVANGLGLAFDEAETLEKVNLVSKNSPDGYTSIYADLRDGRKTEVDTISGSVVRASKKCGVPAPTHEFVVAMVHAMEDKNKN